jgi:quinol monooxygenase YgiN
MSLKITAPLVVVATVKVKRKWKAKFISAAEQMVKSTRQEDGNRMYLLSQSQADPSSFLFYEQWTSEQAIEWHLQTPHMQGFLQKTSAMLEPNSLQIAKYSLV